MKCSTRKSRHKQILADFADYLTRTNVIIISVYVIATAIANKTKAKLYEEDLPSLEDVSQFIIFVEVVSN